MKEIETIRAATLAVNEATRALTTLLDGDDIQQATLIEKCRLFWGVKEAHAELDTAKKALYSVVDRLDKGILPENFDNLGTDKVQVPDLGRSFYTQIKYSASMPDKPAGFNWLRSNGLGDIITETVNAQTLAATIKSFIEENAKEPPEEAIKFSSYKTIGSSKYTPKKGVV